MSAPDPIAICKVCTYSVHADDWAVQPHGRREVVVCVKCFKRASGDEPRPNKTLIREVEDAEGQGAENL